MNPNDFFPIDEEEASVIGLRKHAVPKMAEPDTEYNDGFDDDYYEYEDPEPIICARPQNKRPDIASHKLPSTSEIFRNVNVSAAVDGVGASILAVPYVVSNLAGTVLRGSLDYIKEIPSAVIGYAAQIPSIVSDFFRKHSIVTWAKTRTPKQWLRIGGTCVGVAAAIALCTVLLLMDSLLDKINYVPADHYGYITQSEADALYWSSISETDVSITDISSTDQEEHIEALTLTLDKFTEDMFDIEKDDVVNILLLGTDTRSGNYERDNSDTMMLMSLDTKRNTIKLTSFMRDSYVTIPGYGKYRLNAAFLFGGPELLFKTLEHNFDIEVDQYVRVNFKAFQKVVDSIGGIEMEVTAAEAKYMCSHRIYGLFPRYEAGAGTYKMTGAEALNYARCRKVDSDFGRTNRQRKVILAIAEKLKNSNVSTIYGLMDELLPLVETNITKDEIYSLVVPALSSASKEIETLNVPVKGSWKDYNADGAAVLSLNFKINKKAVRAHIYSTTKLDIEEKVWQNSYNESGSGSTTTTKATTTTTTETTTSTEETTTTTENTTTTTEQTTTKSTTTSRTTTTTKSTTKKTTTTTKPTTTTDSTTESTTTTTTESSTTESTTTTTESTTESTKTTTTAESTTTTEQTTTTTAAPTTTTTTATTTKATTTTTTAAASETSETAYAE